ncbi:PREDICTED: lipoxygenase 3, chloroplastic isoform X1 [Theobroma cacao]|uniref:Lipoxygenase n=1 Tax=Theobroma cacao TaxID=3641 RepID=A0AB32WKP7_THECC|nr:PREDICTED: lipoxygenase 3, chloroplastic isoform X1 [Theobroma cacao]
MAGTREMFCTLATDRLFPAKSPLLGHLSGRRSKFFSSTTSFISGKRRLMRARKVESTPMAALTEVESIEDDQEIPVQFKLTALVTVKYDTKEHVKDFMLRWLDSQGGVTKKGVILQLVSTQIDLRTGKPKMSKEATIDWSRTLNNYSDKVSSHKVQFLVDTNFGVPGAMIVTNKYEQEFYLESIAIEGFAYFACNSWVQPHRLQAEKRIFFSNKAYLPCETPVGLKELREKELRQLRGNGEGVRALSDRIYDYDVYNDLGCPDGGIEFTRPILGGEKCPYPRRCRTGRPPTNTDVNAESPINELVPMYVPRDEAYEELKKETIAAGKRKGLLNNLVPWLKDVSTDNDAIQTFSEIYDLYKESPSLEIKSHKQDGFREKPHFLITINKMIKESTRDIFKFDPPNIISRDPSCCVRDDELGRLTLAGMNPLSIERLKTFPPVSTLDPSVYGPKESAIREEHITCHLNGMSVQQALEEVKLFILDYHDVYLPYLNRINAHQNRKAYATRTIFLLTPMGTLKPIAIELSLPPTNPNSPSKQVLTPPADGTSSWLWQLGKAHVCSNDSGSHQLIHHWLRVHACMEPFIIAAHRQLSIMHPIYRLLQPHMRYTLATNAQAREVLINAEGIIESFFSTVECSMEITAPVYRNWWRFDMDSLPADLIRRGIAVPDQTQPHGLKLLIEDYPYANDGLLIWSAIEDLAQTYVKYYYSEASKIQSDSELNAWYYESINVGHADIRHANWWPKLSTPDDLVSILTIIIWVTSAKHAAVNFGQYHYGGYVPVRPPHMRRLLPNENDPEYATFLADPEGYFLSSLPSLRETTYFMSVLGILSAHSTDEEYLGDRKDFSAWTGDPEIIEAFHKFSIEMRRIEEEIEKRNADPKLRNRCGAGVSPYELLIPSSGPGVTSRGVPNSITT